MVESVGKKLHQARLQRGLTIDEAAHATKLRPDKIAALESDDYSRFANNIYAKGFLQIYGRFLKVDVEEFARTLDNANPISISDYQYLTNAPVTKTETVAVRRDERRPPSLAPLLVFLLVAAAAIGAAWLYQNIERLSGSSTAKTTPAPGVVAKGTPNPDADFIKDPPPGAATPAPQAIAPRPGATTPAMVPRIAPGLQAITPQAITPRPGAATPAAVPRIAPATPAGATPASVAAVTPRAITPGPLTTNQRTTPQPLIGAMPQNTPAPVPGATPAVASPERDFVKPSPVASADNATRPSGVNEVLVAAIKKTWVTVRRDDPKAPPIFEDYVYPNASPLKLKGARFFIEARDPSAVQITKNGLPYAYQPNGGPVQ